MIQFIKKYWKLGLNIGRQNNLHYLQRQQNSILNAIMILSICATLGVTLIYHILDFKYKNIGLIILPVCFLSLWLNSKYKHTSAKYIAYFGILITVTIWCFYTRRTGAHFFYIALGCGVASIFESKKIIFTNMIIAALFFKAYVLWDYHMPFVKIESVNYELNNFMLLYVSAAIIFFQIMVHLDINRSISRSHDKRLDEKKEAIQNLKLTEEKLKNSNNELLSFNTKLDKLVKKSSEELYTYQAAINDNLFSIVTDFEGIIIKINHNYLDKIGYTKQEVVGKSAAILQSNFHSKAFFDTIRKTIYAGKVWRGEAKIKTKTGEDFWLESSIMPIKDNFGKIKNFITVSADITEKKVAQELEQKATENLAKSENRLSLVLENLTDLIVITDKFGNRNFTNTSFCNFFGKTKEYFLGTNYRTLDPKNISSGYLRLFDSLSYQNPKISFLDLMRNSNGEKRWVIWNELAVFDNQQQIVEVFAIGHDITQIKELEFQNANFVAQFEEIAFKTSHDFRGPLSSIMGLMDLLKEDQFNENEIKQVASFMKTAVNNLDNASRDLAAFIDKYNSDKSEIKLKNNLYDFTEAKTKHLNWKYKIRNFLDGIGSLTISQATLHHQSDLGKWYQAEGKVLYGHFQSMQEFELQNEKLHNLVKEILALNEKEDFINAEIKYLELENTSDTILILLDKVETNIRNLVFEN